MSLEKMKRIEGYKNYLVSSWGNVYRTNSALFINPNFGVELPIDNNVKLNPEETKKGYLRVYFTMKTASASITRYIGLWRRHLSKILTVSHR